MYENYYLVKNANFLIWNHPAGCISDPLGQRLYGPIDVREIGA